ncbi:MULTISPECIES: 4a-hydroxytetrahydrobiopterin dehydratase [unclassified Streptomyces]|uniref:4a-hydroxytetrahydrobiopterin dehydratase n=1 Tax=unclassified Streptomyces TaxID=2593676 RepID=UPI0022B74529|nr:MULTISPECIES: 4a-hydroxytetrahydrobiopterin dehydratase [unclassified Streptomyces]MCZ7415829.1 4a-hydroxytetrahydrobiopterin dehydratase [Streptomyces sp. WMMC897]MCZ7434360.1 4a-hydroxytetrahydrobiopterin dehydratase [Streptomyces sp. WMMC1477]
MPAPEPLTDAELSAALAELPGWERDGDLLTRGYRLPGHLPAAAMVMHVAAIHEEVGHHANVALGYNTVGISVNTHSVGGRITALDTALARRIEEIAAGHGAR